MIKDLVQKSKTMPILNSRPIFLCLIFVTGGVILSLELIASRVLTPFFGVSLYIWTAILSITLTFLALGYQFGGWITTKFDEKYHESILLFIPLISALFIFLSCLVYPVIFPKLIITNLIIGSFIGSFILLAFPLVLLSSLNPILIALFRQLPQGKDSGAGFIFFVSTFGAVVGVMMTALLIIPNITNFSAMLVNSIFLGLFTIFTHFLTQKNRTNAVNTKLWIFGILTILLCLSLLLWKNVYLKIVTSNTSATGVRFEILAEYPSHYGNLKVVGIVPKGKKEFSQYVLYQNGLIQNKMSAEGNSLTASTYNLEKLTNFAPHAKNALILGFGVGVVPSKLKKKGMKVSVVDINPNTLSVAKKYFHYKQNNTKIFFEDARMFVRKCVDEYDIVIIDIFHGDGMPEHVTTKEFFQDIKTCLSTNGILVSNAIISLENETTKMSLVATIYSVFSNTHFFITETSFKKDDKITVTNCFIVATKTIPPDNINFNFSDVPKKILNRVVKTLNSYQKIQHINFNKYRIISDNGNSYSSLFAKTYMKFRQDIISYIPARILIN